MLIDPDFLAQDVRADLQSKWLRDSKLSPDQFAAFLNYVNNLMQWYPDEMVPSKVQSRQIDRVLREARRLRAAVEAMGKPARVTLQAHTDFLAFGTTPPVELPVAAKHSMRTSREGDFLAVVWDWVHALELGAEYAGQHIEATRQDKPNEHAARGLVARLAEGYAEILGEWPPADRASWFRGFAETIGERIGVKVGPRLIVGGIEIAKRNTLIATKGRSA